MRTHLYVKRSYIKREREKGWSEVRRLHHYYYYSAELYLLTDCELWLRVVVDGEHVSHLVVLQLLLSVRA